MADTTTRQNTSTGMLTQNVRPTAVQDGNGPSPRIVDTTELTRTSVDRFGPLLCQATPRRVDHSWRDLLSAWFHMLTWLILFALMVLQCANSTLPSVTLASSYAHGAPLPTSPSDPLTMTSIYGNNDDPYIDRAMACVLVGRVYKAATLADALNRSTVIRHPNVTADSYNVLVRKDPQTTLPTTRDAYDSVCSAIALTIDGLIHACRDQGYHPANESLKINIGPDAAYTTELSSALPILILPLFDNGVTARYGLPGVDGAMCSVKLYGQFVGPGAFYQVNVINRTDYDSRTRLWLGQPNGTWENGWFTFTENDVSVSPPASRRRQFYAHMSNDLRRQDEPNGLGIQSVVYDAALSKVADCGGLVSCENQVVLRWDGVIDQVTIELWAESVCIQDVDGNGVFWDSSYRQHALITPFDWGVILANLTVLDVLIRWGISFLALWRGYLYCGTDWHGCGIGIASSSKTFVLLPVLIAPSLKASAVYFWASCIEFEGDLQIVGNAWHTTYPALGQFLLVYFAVLNWVAKCVRIRAPDRTFGLLLVVFTATHWCRHWVGPAVGYPRGAPTLFFAADFSLAGLVDVVFTDAWRIGGRVMPIFVAKVVLLALPIVDLVLTSHRVGPTCKYWPRESKADGLERRSCAIESTLALKTNHCGGLGQSPMYSPTTGRMVGYEVTRLGYLLFGPDNLISFNSYYVVVLRMVSNVMNETYNQRVLVLDPHEMGFRRRMYHWSHPRFCFPWYQVTSVDVE